ncbi:MAG: hypothetical protein J6C59_00335 [Muribaculaceae bacterium]|nr:hypothetical protein [Muribaculaceae bacterium]
MNISVFFHGKPQSEDSFPTRLNEVEHRICDVFFKLNVREYNEIFVSQVIRDNDKRYTAYTFYHNGKDFSGRDKGYFAITITVEGEMFSQVTELYEFLSKSVYANLICNSYGIVDKHAQYQVGSFAAKAKVFGEITGDILHKLDGLRTNPLEGAFETQNSLVRLQFENPHDCDDRQFVEKLRKDGIVCLSMSKMTKKDERIQQLTQDNKRLEAEKKEWQKERSQYQSQMAQLQKEIDWKNQDIRQSKSEQPTYYFEPEPPEETKAEKSSSKLKSFRPADWIIILLIIVSCVISVSSYSCSSPKEEAVNEETNTEVVGDTVVVMETLVKQPLNVETSVPDDEETSQPEIEQQSKDVKDQPATDPAKEDNSHLPLPSPSND